MPPKTSRVPSPNIENLLFSTSTNPASSVAKPLSHEERAAMPPRTEHRLSPSGASPASSTRRSSSPEARAASRSPSPKLSDAFDERTIKNHLGNYAGIASPKKNETESEAKGRYAYKDAQRTLIDREKGAYAPRVNSKVYLSPARENQVASDYDRLIKSGATKGKVQTRGRLAESGKMLGNPKKSSLELHFAQNKDTLASTLDRKQDPRMGHLEKMKRISSIHRHEDSSSSDSND